MAKSVEEAEELSQKAQYCLQTQDGKQKLYFDNCRGKVFEETMRVVDNIDSVLVSCTQLLLNQVYKIINITLNIHIYENTISTHGMADNVGAHTMFLWLQERSQGGYS